MRRSLLHPNQKVCSYYLTNYSSCRIFIHGNTNHRGEILQWVQVSEEDAIPPILCIYKCTCFRGLCWCISVGNNILPVEIPPSRYQMRSRKRRGSSTLFCTEFCRLWTSPSSIGGGFVVGKYVCMEGRVRAALLFIKAYAASLMKNIAVN